jgi:shikimate dehydrogenase
MDELSDRARVLGAVNAYKNDNGRLVGDMTDGPAFLFATRQRGLDPAGARVAMIGGGAAASAIAHACAEQGVADLVLSVRRQERHAALREIVESAPEPPRLSFDLDDLSGFDLVINATTVGMGDDPNVPHPTETLRPDTLVAEVVTMPRITPWLRAALDKGCRIQYGEDMVAAQTQFVSAFWGLPVPEVSFV